MAHELALKPPQPQARLENIVAWIRTAKENLPAINNGLVSTDRIAAMSALLDRLHYEAERQRGSAAAAMVRRKAA